MRVLCGVVLLLVCLLYACASGADLARDRAAREFQCKPEDIDVRWLSADIYRVNGCGQQANYICDEVQETCRAETAPGSDDD